MTTPGLSAALANLAANKNTSNTQAQLEQAQQQATQLGDVNIAKLSVPVTAPQAANAPAPKLTQTERDTAPVAFKGPYYGFTGMITAKGKKFAFYNGYCVTRDPEVIAHCRELEGVEEVPVTSDIPTPPARGAMQARAAAKHPGFSETTMTPMELMTRAVGNSTHVPQAAESFSQTSS